MDRDQLILKKTELIKTIEAVDEVLHSQAWQVLREEFEKRAEVLERQLLNEAKKSPVEADKIYFIQGQILEAKRLDLAPWQDKLKKQLEGIKQHLK